MSLGQPNDDWNPDWGDHPSEWGHKEDLPAEPHTNNDRAFKREQGLHRRCTNLIRQNEEIHAISLRLMNCCYGLGIIAGGMAIGAVLNHAWYKDAERRNENQRITIERMQQETNENAQKITELELKLDEETEVRKFLLGQSKRMRQGK